MGAQPADAGRAGAAFDPQRPGIAGVARHPVLWAMALWAAAHMVPNGDLAHAVLFGVFAAMALAGMAAIDARNRRRMGADAWARLAARTSAVPLAALVTGRWRPSPSRLPLGRAAIAIAVWLLLRWAHQPVIGVSPGVGP